MAAKKCIVPNCNEEGNIRGIFHHLPVNDIHRNKWLSIIGRVDLLDKDRKEVKKLLVCGAHFLPHQYRHAESVYLLPNSLPCQEKDPDQTQPECSQSSTPTKLQIETSFQASSPFDTKILYQSKKTYKRKITFDSPQPSTSQLCQEDSPLPPLPETPPRRSSSVVQTKNRGLHENIQSHLKSLGIKKSTPLSPVKKTLYINLKKTLRLLTNLKRAQKRKPSGRQNDVAFKISQMPEILKIFIISQLQKFHLSKKARRYTNEEKALFLSIYRHSPKCYRYLESILCLPSSRTLRRSLEKLHLKPGINDRLFAFLKVVSEEMDEKSCLCALLFDEMAISPNLSLNKKNGTVNGLENFGRERRPKIADHVLVFMLRGLSRRFKQPVAFYFVQSTAKTFTLKAIICQVVRAIHEKTKFRIIASISDLGSSNRAAVRSLASDYRRCEDFIYNIDGHEIIHIFDPPHLIKCFRNNFMTKDVVFDGQIATWDDIKTIYRYNTLDPNGWFSRLTENHVNPEGKQKMKVKYAAQVFSRSTYAVLVLFKNLNISAERNRFEGTAAFCLFMDQVFDSLNAIYKSTKPLRSRLSLTSTHISFWEDAIQKIRRLTFQKNGKLVTSPPCVSFLLVTIKNVQQLWNRCQGFGFSYLCTRNLNQDPLENFFGVLRGLGGQNTNPTCAQFISAFVTAIVNNSVRSGANSNCADDKNSILVSLQILMSDVPTEYQYQEPNISQQQTYSFPKSHTQTVSNEVAAVQLRNCTSAYIAGFICRKVLIHNCEICDAYFLSSECNDNHALIRLKDTGTQETLLRYPSCDFVMVVEEARRIIFSSIPANITCNILQKLQENLSLNLPLNCDHKSNNEEKIKQYLTYIILQHFFRTTNRKLKKKDVRTNVVIDNFLKIAYPRVA